MLDTSMKTYNLTLSFCRDHQKLLLEYPQGGVFKKQKC